MEKLKMFSRVSGQLPARKTAPRLGLGFGLGLGLGLGVGAIVLETFSRNEKKVFQVSAKCHSS